MNRTSAVAVSIQAVWPVSGAAAAWAKAGVAAAPTASAANATRAVLVMRQSPGGPSLGGGHFPPALSAKRDAWKSGNSASPARRRLQTRPQRPGTRRAGGRLIGRLLGRLPRRVGFGLARPIAWHPLTEPGRPTFVVATSLPLASRRGLAPRCGPCL